VRGVGAYKNAAYKIVSGFSPIWSIIDTVPLLFVLQGKF